MNKVVRLKMQNKSYKIINDIIYEFTIKEAIGRKKIDGAILAV